MKTFDRVSMVAPSLTKDQLDHVVHLALHSTLNAAGMTKNILQKVLSTVRFIINYIKAWLFIILVSSKR